MRVVILRYFSTAKTKPKWGALPIAVLGSSYRGTGIEVRFYPDCCTMAEGVTRRETKSRHAVKRDGFL